MDKFVNLHLHTEYSIGDATIKIPELLYTVKQKEQKAVAITDHGTTEGWSDFYTAAWDTQIKPMRNTVSCTYNKVRNTIIFIFGCFCSKQSINIKI